MVTPETIRIFEFSMVLLIDKTTFKNISTLYLLHILVINDLLQSYIGRNLMLNAS